jgi:peptidoglycan/LPS O-acetylase OafA/YrhL
MASGPMPPWTDEEVTADGRGAARDGRARRRPTGTVRPEIQALRAVAVLTVVLFHLWPDAVRGGFVGVDVFFAISGFLITGLLLREIDRTGRISLIGFWARRARRILPAALLVLLVAAAGTAAWVPLNNWEQFFAEIRASAAYVQNWHLAATAVDYFAADDGASPVQHYWSLSVEEQFYVVWPLLLLAALTIARARPAGASRRAIGVAMGVLTAASFAYGAWRTSADPRAAYFVTPARAWEFGLGGLLALAPATRVGPGARAALSWIGLAAIAVASLTYTTATPFPGVAALLPVLGALAVMRAGAPVHRRSPMPLLGARPVQALGDASYSVYLWHWPLIVLAPFALGADLAFGAKVAILALTLVAAALSKRFVEDPVRSGPLLTRRRARWTFATAAAATAAVVAVGLSGQERVDAQVTRDAHKADAVLAAGPRCFGAAARDPAHPCVNPRLRRTVVPSPVQARDAPNAPCRRLEPEGDVSPCAFGLDAGAAKGTVALVGDSHAAAWRAALEVVAEREHWHGVSITHTGCPLTRNVPIIDQPERSSCVRWNADVPRYLARHREISTVFVVAHLGGDVVKHGQDTFKTQIGGYGAALLALPRSVRHVVVIRDNPLMPASTMACVQRAIGAGRPAGPACAAPRERVLLPDANATAARLVGGRVQVVDLSEHFCGPRTCQPVIGGALVYKDIGHLTVPWARSLGPYLHRKVDALQRDWR